MESLMKSLEKIIDQSVEQFILQIVSKHKELKYEDLIVLWKSVENLKTPKINSPTPSTISTDSKISTSRKVSSYDGNGCPHTLTRGDRKGSPCGKKPVSGGTYCSSHKKYENEPPKERKAVPTAKTEIKDSNRVIRKKRGTDILYHPQTNMVFRSTEDKVVIGSLVGDKVMPLTNDNIDTCKKWGFKIADTNMSEKKVETASESVKSSNVASVESSPEDQLVKALSEIKVVNSALGVGDDDEDPVTENDDS